MITTKKTHGLSYIEVIIALALFAIAMLALLPTLSQAGRNLSLAQDLYTSHLQAQRIMLTVRDALTDGVSPEQRVLGYAAGNFEFSVWISGQGAREFHSSGAPNAGVSVAGINMVAANHASTIVAVVWNHDGRVAGRAIGMMHL